MKVKRINHVMGNEVSSRIFQDILDNFYKYSKFENQVSIQPIQDKSCETVYIHHRINRSDLIPENSIAFVHHDLDDFDLSLDSSHFLQKYSKCRGVVCLNSNQKYIIDRNIGGNSVVIPHGYSSRHVDMFAKVRKIRMKGSKFKMGVHGKVGLMINSRRYLRGVKGEGTLYQLANDLDPNVFELFFVGRDRHIDQIFFQKCGFDAYSVNPSTYDGVLECYASVDLLLNLSWHEGGPANLPESLNLSTPVFSRNIGMASDLLPDSMKFDSYTELLNMVNWWHSSPDFRSRIMLDVDRSRGNLLSSADAVGRLDNFIEEL